MNEQPPLWFINIAFICCHFSSLWFDSAVVQTHNLPFWWRVLYQYTTSRYSVKTGVHTHAVLTVINL